MAQMFADMMKERSRRPYKFNDKMRALISDKLEKYLWSPEQIRGYCQANDIEMVSVEWIYRFIREDKRNGGSLYRHCRHRLKHRKRPIGAGVRNIPDRLSIRERPPEVEKREEFGHFEMDLIQNGKDFILTIVERKTGFLIMERLTRGKNAEEVAKTVIRLLKSLKKTRQVHNN